VEACEALGDEFRARAGDASEWGLAKSMVMRMLAEGVDPGEPGALDAWIVDVNGRPREQLDAIVGPAVDRMLHGAGLHEPTGSHAPKHARAQRRKAQRTARKRNRRR
jgi:hypothetical protein